MNRSTHALIGLLAFAGTFASALAADAPPANPGTSSAPLTRAEVKAETLRALAAHEVVFGEIAYPRQPDRLSGTPAKARTAATR